MKNIFMTRFCENGQFCYVTKNRKRTSGSFDE